jgi:uncharacterized protein YegP (UPF0339 family)
LPTKLRRKLLLGLLMRVWFSIYKNKNNKYKWELRTSAGIICQSPYPHLSIGSCLEQIESLKDWVEIAPIKINHSNPSPASESD